MECDRIEKSVKLYWKVIFIIVETQIRKESAKKDSFGPRVEFKVSKSRRRYLPVFTYVRYTPTLTTIKSFWI